MIFSVQDIGTLGIFHTTKTPGKEISVSRGPGADCPRTHGQTWFPWSPGAAPKVQVAQNDNFLV
jgi:hypothetical protein